MLRAACWRSGGHARVARPSGRDAARCANSCAYGRWTRCARKRHVRSERTDHGRTHPFDALKSLQGTEGTEGVSVRDYSPGERGSDARKALEGLGGGGVEVQGGQSGRCGQGGRGGRRSSSGTYVRPRPPRRSPFPRGINLGDLAFQTGDGGWRRGRSARGRAVEANAGAEERDGGEEEHGVPLGRRRHALRCARATGVRHRYASRRIFSPRSPLQRTLTVAQVPHISVTRYISFLTCALPSSRDIHRTSPSYLQSALLRERPSYRCLARSRCAAAHAPVVRRPRRSHSFPVRFRRAG